MNEAYMKREAAQFVKIIGVAGFSVLMLALFPMYLVFYVVMGLMQGAVIWFIQLRLGWLELRC